MLKSVLPVNVKDHGAKGDGETDDAAAFQAAIDAAAATGQPVCASFELRDVRDAEFVDNLWHNPAAHAGWGMAVHVPVDARSGAWTQVRPCNRLFQSMSSLVPW